MAAAFSHPRMDDATVLPRSRRIRVNASIPIEVTAAAAGLRAGGGGIFRISFAGRHEFGDQTARDLTDGLPCVVGFHAPTMEPTDARYRRKAFTFEGKENARRY